MLKTTGRHVLRKWYNRTTNTSKAWAFETWSSNVNNLKHRERLVADVRAHLLKFRLRKTLARWKQAGSQSMVMEFEQMVMEEEGAIQQQATEIKRETENRRKQAD